MDRLSDAERKLWHTFLSANVQLMERLDHELQQRSHLSLTDYEILDALASTPDQRLRMSELAGQVLVSRSRLTYRVNRLVNVGYLSREECEDDRRGLFAMLTSLGHQALEVASSGHITDVRTWFFDVIEPDELAVLERVVTRMDAKLSSN